MKRIGRLPGDGRRRNQRDVVLYFFRMGNWTLKVPTIFERTTRGILNEETPRSLGGCFYFHNQTFMLALQTQEKFLKKVLLKSLRLLVPLSVHWLHLTQLVT